MRLAQLVARIASARTMRSATSSASREVTPGDPQRLVYAGSTAIAEPSIPRCARRLSTLLRVAGHAASAGRASRPPISRCATTASARARFRRSIKSAIGLMQQFPSLFLAYGRCAEGSRDNAQARLAYTQVKPYLKPGTQLAADVDRALRRVSQLARTRKKRPRQTVAEAKSGAPPDRKRSERRRAWLRRP